MRFMIAILVCMLFSTFTSCTLQNTFVKYDRVRCRSGMTGYAAVPRLMRTNSVFGSSVGRVSETMSDCYHPKNQSVNHSESTYNSNWAVTAIMTSLVDFFRFPVRAYHVRQTR